MPWNELLKKDVTYLKMEIWELKWSVSKISDKIDDKFDKLDETLKREYVSKDEFSPVKIVVYSLMGIITASVIGAIISLVIK